MGKIIWIDDDMGKMTLLAQYLFPILWDKDYINYIIFAGNHFAKFPPHIYRTERARKEFSYDMSSYFEDFCREKIDNNNNTPMKVWNLKEYLYPKWDNFEEQENDEGNIEGKIKDKIDKIINENTFIGIDLCLLTEDEKPEAETLAMKLFYFYFFEREREGVFLYSNFINEKAEKKEWVDKFVEHHKNIGHLKDKIIIQSGYELTKKPPSVDLNMFLKFLESGNITELNINEQKIISRR